MTQKELLYVEDAIGHEKNMIAVCQETISCLKEEKLKVFLEKEIKKHENMQKKLMKMLEDNANE